MSTDAETESEAGESAEKAKTPGWDSLVFTSLDKHGPVSEPGWFMDWVRNRGRSLPSGHSFVERVAELSDEYGVESRTLAYRDAERDEWVRVPGFQAVVNPAWEGRDPDDERTQPDDGHPDSAAWYTATDSYDPVTAKDVYAPLQAVIRRRELTEVVGEFRLYRAGGEVHGDVFLPELSFGLSPDGGESVRVVPGISTGYDHFTQTTLYARPVFAHAGTGGVIRGLGEKRTRTHRKSKGDESGQTAKDVVQWWDVELDRLIRIGKRLTQVVIDASEHTVEFDRLPFGPEGFYKHLGLPSGLASEGQKRLKQQCTSSPRSESNLCVSSWSLARAGFEVLTYDYDGKDDGTALRSHVSTVNTILFQPARAEHDAIEAWDREYRMRDQTTLTEDEPMVEGARDRMESLKGRVDTTETLQSRLASLLEVAEGSGGSDGGGEGS